MFVYPKTAFCEECREEHPYSLEKATLCATLKNDAYSYAGTKATCTCCGAEVYVAEVEDANLRSLYDVYRQENNIISHAKIREIPQKYDIGKRPLSLLLGWGEMTFSRYYDGDMPSKQYSDELQRIYEEPEYYLSLLEKNRGNLRSQHAYEKSRRKVMDLLAGRSASTGKIDLVISYLLSQCEDVTPLALQKALYYVQGFHYAFTDVFLFSEDCEAWVHGPVYRRIYNRYASYRFDPIASSSEFDTSVFTETEKAVIDGVVQSFCCYSGKILERFTHSEMPWLITRANLPANEPSNRVISKQFIGEYFSAVKEKYDMLTPYDMEDYARDMFSKTARG